MIKAGIETSLGKVIGMMQMFMTNSNFSKVQNVPCSMCFSRNQVDGECVENNKEYTWSYASSYNLWHGHEYANYCHDPQPLFPPKPCFHQYIQHQMIENNSNDSTLKDMMSMIEKL